MNPHSPGPQSAALPPGSTVTQPLSNHEPTRSPAERRRETEAQLKAQSRQKRLQGTPHEGFCFVGGSRGRGEAGRHTGWSLGCDLGRPLFSQHLVLAPAQPVVQPVMRKAFLTPPAARPGDFSAPSHPRQVRPIHQAFLLLPLPHPPQPQATPLQRVFPL